MDTESVSFCTTVPPSLRCFLSFLSFWEPFLTSRVKIAVDVGFGYPWLQYTDRYVLLGRKMALLSAAKLVSNLQKKKEVSHNIAPTRFCNFPSTGGKFVVRVNEKTSEDPWLLKNKWAWCVSFVVYSLCGA